MARGTPSVKIDAYANKIHPQLLPLAVPLESVHPDPNNARSHDRDSIEAIRRSYLRFGQRKPIVVQRKGMICRSGNGQLQAARLLGWTHIAAVLVDEGDAEATGFAIADNRTAELSTWATEALSAAMKSLSEQLYDSTGFAPSQAKALAELLDRPVSIKQIEVTKPRAKTWTLIGIDSDLYDSIAPEITAISGRTGVFIQSVTSDDPLPTKPDTGAAAATAPAKPKPPAIPRSRRGAAR